MADMAENSDRQADAEFVDALVQLSFSVQAVISEVGSRYELSSIQARLLGILRDREPAMAELARFLKLDKSSITGLVDRAERRGLVRRTASPRDGRSVHVQLTGEGRQLATACAAEVRRHVSWLARGMTEAERRRLAVLAGQLLQGERQLPVP
jgi:MarR family transcriptional regulator, lower aerobic nicotinate degradation pathway regulator